MGRRRADCIVSRGHRILSIELPTLTRRPASPVVRQPLPVQRKNVLFVGDAVSWPNAEKRRSRSCVPRITTGDEVLRNCCTVPSTSCCCVPLRYGPIGSAF